VFATVAATGDGEGVGDALTGGASGLCVGCACAWAVAARATRQTKSATMLAATRGADVDFDTRLILCSVRQNASQVLRVRAGARRGTRGLLEWPHHSTKVLPAVNFYHSLR
jgi:hypothetical protein